MVKDIVIVADLGAAGNLIRNLLLLSDQVHWPLNQERFKTVSAQYRSGTRLDQWLPIEYRLRFWKQYYNVDISDTIDLHQWQCRKRQDQPVVYLNHSAFYQPNQYQHLNTEAKIFYVCPTTDFGLDWQVRSYCEKVSLSRLHNFTFTHNADQLRDEYCRLHGVDAYYRLNINNFRHIIGSRQREFGQPDVSLEILLSGTASQVVESFQSKLDIAVDSDMADTIINQWRKLHWFLDTTYDWPYHASSD